MPRTYELTAGKVISDARRILADRHPLVAPRYTDADLLAPLNEAMSALVGVVPGLFTSLAPHVCTAGYLQTLVNARATTFLRAVDLPEGDIGALSAFAPRWTQAGQGVPREFMRLPGDPQKFAVYPPAFGGESILVQFVQAPAEITSTADRLPVPEPYGPALVEFVAGRVETADDESVNSGRADLMLKRFRESAAALGV